MSKLIDRLLPPELRADPRTRLNAHLGIILPFVYLGVAIVFVAVHLAVGSRVMPILISVTIIPVVAAPVLMVRTRSLRLGAHIFSSVFTCLIVLTALYSPSAMWRSLCWIGPLAIYALFLAGRLAAAGWTIVASAAVLALYLLPSFGIVLPDHPETHSRALDLTTLLLLGGATCLLAVLGDRVNASIMRELDETRAGLARAQRLARMGSFEFDLATGQVKVSESLRELYQLDRCTNLAVDELIGLIHPDDQPDVFLLLEKLRAEAIDASFGYRVARGDGTYRSFFGISHPICDARGRVIGLCGTAQDVTESKLAEAQLIHARQAALDASQAKSQFLANMSHELRTPMNAIIGMTALALDSQIHGEPREYVKTASEAAHRLLEILNDILDLSKVEAGRLTMENVPFAVRELVHEVAETVALRAHEKDLELVVDVDPGLAATYSGDPVRIRQILLNLAGNAVKFTSQGQVIIAVEPAPPDRGVLRFVVEDSGPGIPEDAHQRIFEAFRQADGSTTRRFGGTGLGLTISRQLAELMGGALSLESGLGRGSRFFVDLPLEAHERRAFVPVSAGGRVLLLDDHARARKALARDLSSRGFEVLELSDRAELYDAVAREKVAAVIVDRGLSDGDGLTVLRALGETSFPKVLLADADKRPIASALAAAGSARVAAKPARIERLLELFAGEVAPVDAAGEPPKKVDPLAVLLAEDNRVNALVAMRVLERSGHTVTWVESGVRAVELALSKRFDVVLMDVQMPELDGIEATKKIREEEEHIGGHVPIVALTANAMKDDDAACYAVGMDAYLTKPLEPRRLVEMVATMAERRSAA